LPAIPTAKQYKEISNLLSDPVTQVTITVHQQLLWKRTYESLATALEHVITKSKGDKNKLYKVKFVDKGVSVFIYNGLVVASVSDAGEPIERRRLTALAEGKGLAEAWSVEVDVLGEDLAKALGAVSEEIKEPPEAWINRVLLGFMVEDVISVKGAFSYVLRARAPWGEKVAVKVARDKDESGKPLVLGDRAASIIYKLVSEAGILQRIHSVDDRLLRILLRARGHSSDLANHLINFKDNIVKVFLVHAPFIKYNSLEEYINYPPFAVFELADGDISDIIKALSKISERDRIIESISLQIAGALALAHAVGVGHFDLKPANILYKRENKGIIVKVADFSGYNQVDGEFIVDIVTPEYGDPLILLNKGRGATLSSDVFGWGALAGRLYKGRPIICHFAINSILLSHALNNKELEAPLANLVKRLGADYEKYYGVVKDAIKEMVDNKNWAPHDLISRLEDDYNKCLEVELRDVPEHVYGVIKKALRLVPESRFKDMIQVYEILKEL
jgi:serine/threonine protein kinase